MKFSQLSKDAKARARDWYRENCVNDNDWWRDECDTCKEQLAEKGFDDADISFCGFSSQGDGASFTGNINHSRLELPAELKQRIEEAKQVAIVLLRFNGEHREPDIEIEIDRARIHRCSSHYVHSLTIDAEVEFILRGRDMSGELEQAITNWAFEQAKALTEEARTLSDQIYRALEAEWDYQNSNAAVDDAIEANDWRFHEDGSLLPKKKRIFKLKPDERLQQAA